MKRGGFSLSSFVKLCENGSCRTLDTAAPRTWPLFEGLKAVVLCFLLALVAHVDSLLHSFLPSHLASPMLTVRVLPLKLLENMSPSPSSLRRVFFLAARTRLKKKR